MQMMTGTNQGAAPPSLRSLARCPLSRPARGNWGQGYRQVLASFFLVPLLAWCPACAAAATDESRSRVSVTFVEPEKFTDVLRAELDHTSAGLLRELEKFLLVTGSRYVPEEMQLKIRVTDIDLAGDFELFRGPQADQVRIMRGLYPPRIALEFELLEGAEEVVAAGQRSLTDIEYQLRPALPADDYLRYEKKILRDWLRVEFGALRPRAAISLRRESQ